MAIRIQANQIQNLQQIDAAVAGPDGANRLIAVSGQFDGGISAFSQAAAASQQTQTFTVLLGPVLTRQQFFRASGSASAAKTFVNIQAAPFSFSWGIAAVDADWDDESGQVELRIEAFVSVSGTSNSAAINGFGFQVTILAAVA
jgi:hypothetical protein